MSYNVQHVPQVNAKTLANSSTYAGSNLITYTGVSKRTVIQNLTASNVTCKLNGLSTAVFTLVASGTMTLDRMDVTSVDFANSSGGSVSVEVIAAIVTQ